MSRALIVLLASGALSWAADRAAWMKQARWGIMTHYLADWISKSGEPMTPERWNGLIDRFDVATLARQIESTGAGYYLITLGQNSGYYLAPNSTYGRLTGIQPGKCAHRDLVADLYEALHARGIRLMVYLPAGAPDRDEAAIKALEWRKGAFRNREFQLKWEQVIREWSMRWGRKISGWWFDGCYWPNTMYRTTDAPNFASFAAAARAGNPESALAFNPGVFQRLMSITPEEDYVAGEINDPERVSIPRGAGGKLDGAQIHVLTFLGERWGGGAPRFTPGQAAAISAKLMRAGAAVTWDTPIQLNGTIAEPFLERLRAVGKAVAGK